MSKIYTVHELAQLLKSSLETRFPFIWVRGQVSNLSRPGSGHIYFTLKDEDSCLDAVWFKQMHSHCNGFNPLTGEVFDENEASGRCGDGRPNLALNLENGEEILCAGKITLYPPRGRLQMVVELAQAAGLGFLQQEFELLKQKLFARGWFSIERKRSLPPNPARVAVVTAPSGAVIHDFLRIARTRGQGGEIRIYPSQVQGDGAPESIATAIKEIQEHAWAEVVVLIRGGGSLEDLWAFNSELVAQAIVNSQLPVITGIGHEPDISIADLAADVRAATPSHAAQLIWTEKNILTQQIDEMEITLHRLSSRHIENLEINLTHLVGSLQFLSPVSRLKHGSEKLTALFHTLQRNFNKLSKEKQQKLAMLTQNLNYALPDADLQAKEILTDNLLSRLEMLTLNRLTRFESRLIPESHICSLVNQILIRYGNKLPTPSLLASHITRLLQWTETGLALAEARLDGLNPLRPLSRGYALVQTQTGGIISNSAQAKPGQQVEILLGKGSLEAEIKKIY